MPQLAWAIPVQKVLTDKSTNSVSYIDAIEGYMVEELPVSFSNFRVGLNWWREQEGEEFVVRVRVRAPSGDIVGERVTERVQFEDYHRLRVTVSVKDLTVQEAGEHWIEVETALDESSGWDVETRVPFVILKEERDES